jgi:hypothetical protein
MNKFESKIIEPIVNFIDGGIRRGKRKQEENMKKMEAKTKELEAQSNAYFQKKKKEEDEAEAKRQYELNQEKIAREYLGVIQKKRELEEDHLKEVRAINDFRHDQTMEFRNADAYLIDHSDGIAYASKKEKEISDELSKIYQRESELYRQLTKESEKKYVEPVEKQRELIRKSQGGQAKSYGVAELRPSGSHGIDEKKFTNYRMTK